MHMHSRYENEFEHGVPDCDVNVIPDILNNENIKSLRKVLHNTPHLGNKTSVPLQNSGYHPKTSVTKVKYRPLRISLG